MFSVLERIAFEPVARISLNYDGNTCDPHAMCYERVLRYHV